MTLFSHHAMHRSDQTYWVNQSFCKLNMVVTENFEFTLRIKCASVQNRGYKIEHFHLLLQAYYFTWNNVNKWNESGFRPPLCTYRLNWARRTSWGWWDDWDDTVLQTQEIMWIKWNEWGLRPPLCTYRLNWARRTSWGLWDKWDDREETFCLKLECQCGVRTRDFPHFKQTALTTAPEQPLVKSCKHSFMVAIVNTKKLNQQQHANIYAGLMNGKFYRRYAAFM